MPEVRVQDEQGNVHVFPDGSTPEMIAQVMNVKPPSAQSSQPQNQDTGVLASLKRTGSSLVHLPGAVYDAFAKPASPEEDISAELLSRSHGIPKTAALALNRLIVAPMAQKVQAADQAQKQYNAMTPEQQAADRQNSTGLYHTMTTNRIASMVPLVGPMAEDITHRYLTGDKSGAVTDVIANAAVPKIAEGAVNAVPSLARAATPFAERVYQSALKPSTTLSPVERANVVRTGLDAGVAVTDKGAGKLQGLIDNLNTAVKAEIAKNPNAPINKFQVASRLSDTAKTFANQVAPTRDLSSIAEVGNDFLANQPGAITAENAQSLKTGTYQRLKSRSYGEAGSATTEAEKSLARGLKEEIENYFPEVKGMNAQTSKFYGLQEELERAVNRARNHNLIGLGSTASAAGGAAAGAAIGHPLSAATGGLIIKAILDDPAFKSKLAIAISNTGKIAPKAAFTRVGQFTNALAQSLGTGVNQAGAESQ